jgi:hypothetical protein
MNISDTCKNQTKRLDFDNTINLSSLIVILGTERQRIRTSTKFGRTKWPLITGIPTTSTSSIDSVSVLCLRVTVVVQPYHSWPVVVYWPTLGPLSTGLLCCLYSSLKSHNRSNRVTTQDVEGTTLWLIQDSWFSLLQWPLHWYTVCFLKSISDYPSEMSLHIEFDDTNTFRRHRVRESLDINSWVDGGLCPSLVVWQDPFV